MFLSNQNKQILVNYNEIANEVTLNNENLKIYWKTEIEI